MGASLRLHIPLQHLEEIPAELMLSMLLEDGHASPRPRPQSLLPMHLPLFGPEACQTLKEHR